MENGIPENSSGLKISVVLHGVLSGFLVCFFFFFNEHIFNLTTVQKGCACRFKIKFKMVVCMYEEQNRMNAISSAQILCLIKKNYF